jgi:hypothetical protein
MNNLSSRRLPHEIEQVKETLSVMLFQQDNCYFAIREKDTKL